MTFAGSLRSNTVTNLHPNRYALRLRIRPRPTEHGTVAAYSDPECPRGRSQTVCAVPFRYFRLLHSPAKQDDQQLSGTRQRSHEGPTRGQPDCSFGPTTAGS